ncbi:hypothetical protein [Actinokineospora fastidiosa]|uniref:Uncharacterized protein n=1 Tax=Actinokineospora fastidiosa TaxID=1816 RepID=A0A918G2E8_9PSEU|nr:hypothetical protein [Actinokineospora fastidiosa]GGS16017.1 hypothetical protein GCM10010171_05190 [Actinokineospora fastidiosa]
MSGFEVDVDRAHQAATVSLPQAAFHLARPASLLKQHEGLRRDGGESLPALDALQVTYATYSDNLAARLVDAVGIIHETAQALEEIVLLYRRADGQG